jgi:CheY-like chemotaxis protein
VYQAGRKVRLFSALEVANICGVVNQTAINWIRNGYLKAFTTPGGQYRVYAEDLSSFLDKRGMRIPEEILQPLRNDADWTVILVVDNDRKTNDFIKKGIKKQLSPYTVIYADDVFDAGRKVVEVKPGFVLLAADLQGIDSYALARRLKEEQVFGKPFVIMMTQEENAEARHISAAWADAFLPKPLDFDRFCGIIRDLEKRVKPANTA